MPPPAIRMMSWGARVLYLGPAFSLSAHRNAVGVLCVGLEGRMEVFAGEGLKDRRGTDCRSAYVPPGTRHLINFEPGRIACLYVDRESDDPARIAPEMEPADDGILINHRRHEAILGVLKDLCAGRLASERRRALVAAAYGLSDTSDIPSDERISGAIRAILEDPSLPHRATSLARQAGLSESRFRHAFREATGVPLKRYRVWARLGAAMRAARAGANLTEAAHEAGFSSSAHFSSAYRAMFGLTPSAFVAAAQSIPDKQTANADQSTPASSLR